MNENTAKRPEKKKKRLFAIAFIALNVIIIGTTAYLEFGKGGGADFSDVTVKPLYIIGGFLCFFAALAADTSKFMLLLKKICGRTSLRIAFNTAALGKYYDNITPSGVGGQPFQIYYLSKQGIRGGDSAAIPAGSYITGQFAFVLLALYVFIFNSSLMGRVGVRIVAWFGLAVFSFFPCAVLFFTLAPYLADKLLAGCVKLLAKLRIVKKPEERSRKVLAMMEQYRSSILPLLKRGRLMLALLCIGVVYRVAICSIPYFVLKAFGGGMSWVDALSASVYVYATITYIPTPGNAGVAEGSFYMLFSSLTGGYLFWAMLVWRFFCYYMFIIVGAGIYLVGYIQSRRRKSAQT